MSDDDASSTRTAAGYDCWDDSWGYDGYYCDPYFDYGFGMPFFGGGYYYTPPYAITTEEIIHERPAQPQVVVVNTPAKSTPAKKEQEVQYVMADPNDPEGKRLITVDPNKVKGANAEYVVDNNSRPNMPSTQDTSNQQKPIVVVQQPAAPIVMNQQETPVRKVKKSKKKRNFCCCS